MKQSTNFCEALSSPIVVELDDEAASVEQTQAWSL